jgi:hypothetical protein
MHSILMKPGDEGKASLERPRPLVTQEINKRHRLDSVFRKSAKEFFT